MQSRSDIEIELRELLGDDAFLRLVDRWGGTRLYIANHSVRSQIFEHLGSEASHKLSEEFGRLYIKVPLARKFRAHRYRQEGLPNSAIALKLGMTESGVGRLFEANNKRTVSLSKRKVRAA
ncbi:MAG: hypothetical protein M9924_14840 [Rhizobiaceae bacterium]|nr:hypothetical protein [Rhizobiaceae bacterium]